MEREGRNILKKGATLAAGAALGFVVGVNFKDSESPTVLGDCPPTATDYVIKPHSRPVEVIAQNGFVVGDVSINGEAHYDNDFNTSSITLLRSDSCSVFNIDAPWGTYVYVAGKNEDISAGSDYEKRIVEAINELPGKPVIYLSQK